MMFVLLLKMNFRQHAVCVPSYVWLRNVKWLYGFGYKWTENGCQLRGSKKFTECSWTNSTKGFVSCAAPCALRKQLAREAHVLHQGITRTISQLRDIMYYYVLEVVTNCSVCANSKKSMKFELADPVPTDFVLKPWHTIAIDIVEFRWMPPSHRYAVTFVDYYSKWPEVAFTSSIKLKIK